MALVWTLPPYNESYDIYQIFILNISLAFSHFRPRVVKSIIYASFARAFESPRVASLLKWENEIQKGVLSNPFRALCAANEIKKYFSIDVWFILTIHDEGDFVTYHVTTCIKCFFVLLGPSHSK